MGSWICWYDTLECTTDPNPPIALGEQVELRTSCYQIDGIAHAVFCFFTSETCANCLGIHVLLEEDDLEDEWDNSSPTNPVVSTRTETCNCP
jgi:hypothetical protein